MDIRTGVAPPTEYPVTLHVNDRPLVTVQATPDDLEDFALGMLFTEGIIDGAGDVQRILVSDRGVVWAELQRVIEAPGEPGALAASSERGAVAAPVPASPVPPGIRMSIPELAALMARMIQGAERYRRSRGIHSALAARPAAGEWILREDIGRHNAVDKVIGAALARGWEGPDVVVCTSGRISYEMCVKLARFGVGIAASRTAATDMACDLADALGMDLVGYLRTASRYTLYTAGRRLIIDETG